MVSPFLKWAGGKRWLVADNRLPASQQFSRYVEPFLGGGAIFFHMAPTRALLSDVNEELIHVYDVMKVFPQKLYTRLLRHQKLHSKDYYYKIRNSRPKADLERAARFLYLNRACWNGLYRVNLRGDFNVPIGTKTNIIFDTDDFDAIADRLRNVELRCSDFEPVIDECQFGDFVFVDPPYTVKHNQNNFLKYNENIFRWDDQIRLCETIKRAAERGVAFIITNADHSSVRALYNDFSVYDQLHRHSKLAASASKRRKTTEAIFLVNATFDQTVQNSQSLSAQKKSLLWDSSNVPDNEQQTITSNGFRRLRRAHT